MNKKPNHRNLIFLLIFTISILSGGLSNSFAGGSPEVKLNVIPYPKQVKTTGTNFSFGKELTVTVVLDKTFTKSDSFTAEELIRDLKKEFNISAVIGKKGNYPYVVLTRQGGSGKLKEQGYTIKTNEKELVISAWGESGLFYGSQTFLQLIRRSSIGYEIPGLEITDWPDIQQRAIHYDTKHHQDKASYVKSFIKDLSRYKVNMLIWEWEDKFEYPSHPEIGAPGAFTKEEMQEFTRYAKQYHIQMVPLVQGLGHVSFILKWPQYRNLRELESSNFEFCPLKDESYALLNDLWKDAMEATPGSEYIHIGSDETYELGECENCRAKAAEIGRSGLYQLFINRAAKYLTAQKRKVMAWETPMGWKIGESPAKGIGPVPGLVFTESYDYETPEMKYVKESRALGFEVFAYDPNPGVVPMMVPYYFEKGDAGEIMKGSLEKSHGFVSQAAGSGIYNGVICTSWDDDGLHNQMWMMHFINAAAFSWNGSAPSPDEFRKSYFSDYYGTASTEMDEIFKLLNEGVYYFAGTMERNVWHYGEIGQTHLPDMPRGDAIEYDPFWNTQYKDKIEQSRAMLAKMETVLGLIKINENAAVRHAYDFEIFRTTANMIKHTCLTYIDLSNLEYTIKEAHVNRFVDCRASVKSLVKAQDIIRSTLARRDSIFNDLVRTYEETRLPRGLSSDNKKYFWQQDRTRHFGFRRPDMSFLIYDEQLLDMEGYLEKLKAYTDSFKSICEN